ncbi:MAG: PAS domain S-box protein, partial [Chloroflexota bacterium]
MPRSARAKRTAHDEIARLLHDPDADPARLEQMTVRQLAEEVRFCHRKLAEYEAARAQPSPEPPRNLPQDLPTDEFEQELRHAIDVIPALLWSSDPDGAIDYVNDSWLSYTGMTLDQALDMGWAQALHPDDAAETERSWSAAVQSGTVFEVEQRLRRHDGDYHWFLARARPAVGADGRVQKWYGASTDITEYKRVQKSLAYQAHLLENISEAIIASDEHYRLTAWNAAAAAMYGWSAEQVLGRTGLDVIQTRFSEADKSQMLQQIATQGYYHGRATQARKDGSRFPVDVSSYVLRDEAGRVTGFVSINRDITAQLQAEEILRESEARFSSIFYASPVGILVFRRRDDCVVDCNDAFLDLTGYTREELLEHAPDELGLFPNPDERRAWLLRLQSRSGVRNISLTLRKKSGEIRFAMVSMALFEARAEPLVMLLAIDITSLKRAEAQLMLAETELEQKVIERTAELRIQQQILQIFVEHAPAAIAMLDKDLRFLAVSRRYLEDYRLGEHPLLGRKYEEVFPATSERWRAIYQACLAGEVEKREEDLFQHADGSLDWVRWEAHPWYQRPNQVGGIFIFSELITERKRAEQDLLETQRRLQMAVRSGKTGLWDWNLHTNRVHYSLEYKQLLGHTDQEFSDHYLEWESRLHPDDRRHALDVQTDFLQQPAHGYWNRFRMRHKDGGYRWILAQGDLLYDTQGRPERMLGSIIDITELVRAQEIIEEKMAEVELVNRDLARALQTKDEFLNAMSHELR